MTALSEKLKLAIRDVQDYPKPGIVFKDITPIFGNPQLVNETVCSWVEEYKSLKIDAVLGVEARGFIFGSVLAHELNCSFIPVRKAGKLPYKVIAQSYALEYGNATIEMHIDAVKPGWRVLIHDDLLATGGTAGAAAELVTRAGGVIAGFSFLINLSFLPGEQNLKDQFGVNPHYMISY
jgi:adenine phosphoribosyltransferase